MSTAQQGVSRYEHCRYYSNVPERPSPRQTQQVKRTPIFHRDSRPSRPVHAGQGIRPPLALSPRDDLLPSPPRPCLEPTFQPCAPGSSLLFSRKLGSAPKQLFGRDCWCLPHIPHILRCGRCLSSSLLWLPKNFPSLPNPRPLEAHASQLLGIHHPSARTHLPASIRSAEASSVGLTFTSPP